MRGEKEEMDIGPQLLHQLQTNYGKTKKTLDRHEEDIASLKKQLHKMKIALNDFAREKSDMGGVDELFEDGESRDE